MRVGAFLSAILHLALILLFVFGLPNFFAPDEVVEAIPVQVVTKISDRTTQTETPMPAPPAPAPKPEPQKPAESRPEPPPPPAPEPPAPPKPAEPQTAPEPTPAPQPEPVPEPVLAPPEPQPQPEPAPEEVREAKVEPPPPAPPQKPKPPQVAEKPKDAPKPEPEPEPVSDITSVLKNVEKLKQKAPETAESAEQPTQQAAASPAPLGDELSASERDAIANQIQQCWIVDIGMQGIEEIVVALHVQYNPDGSVHRIEFADPLQIAADHRYRVLAERARAAVQQCSPIRVSSNYRNWKNITFRFSPKGMLGL